MKQYDGGNIFLQFDIASIVNVTFDDDMTLRDFIENIVIKKFPILKSIDISRIYFISSKVLENNELTLNSKLKDLNGYFKNMGRYTVKISPMIAKTPEYHYVILKKLFTYLEKFAAYDTVQIIISLFSSNTNDNEKNAEKNLIQQFQYKNIKKGKKVIFYVLIDAAFFGTNIECYDMFKYNTVTIKELGPIDTDIIKKYTLAKPFVYSHEKEFPQYYKLFRREVKPLIEQCTVQMYILKLYLNPEILTYIDSYKKIFDIYTFGGEK